MSEQTLFWVAARNPSISDTITVDNVAVDLTGKTVRFKMRPVNSSTLKVDASVSNTPDATGAVRYDWLTVDVDTAGEFLVWWEVTTSGKAQVMNEAVIEFRAHGPATIPAYVELEQFKSTLELTSTTFSDQDCLLALDAASRTIDAHCNRRFYPDTDAIQVRYYDPFDRGAIPVDDLIALTSIKTDAAGAGTYDQTWTATDYLLEPQNAVANGQPYTIIRRRPSGNFYFHTRNDHLWGYPMGSVRLVPQVQVTGKFGWSSVPSAVRQATTILAGRLLKRSRETPYGIAPGLGMDGGGMRIGSVDYDVQMLLAPLVRRAPGLGGFSSGSLVH